MVVAGDAYRLCQAHSAGRAAHGAVLSRSLHRRRTARHLLRRRPAPGNVLAVRPASCAALVQVADRAASRQLRQQSPQLPEVLDCSLHSSGHATGDCRNRRRVHGLPGWVGCRSLSL